MRNVEGGGRWGRIEAAEKNEREIKKGERKTEKRKMERGKV